MKHSIKALMLGASLAVLAAPMAMAQTAPSAANQAQAPWPALTLSASGEVEVTPDMASLNFGVMTEEPTAQAAMSANAEQMTRVIAALRRAGIAERDIQTSGLNLSAQYDYQENQPPKLRGYQATNRVTVNILDLAKVGTTADAVVAAGVNQIDGISFGLQDSQAAEDEARRVAVQALQAKAQLYAQALNVSLGSVRAFTETGGYAPQPPQPILRAQFAEARSTPVSAGQLTVRIDVTGVYDMGR